MRLNVPGKLSPALFWVMTCEYKKLVTPITRTFSRTPMMIWSTKYLIASEARIVDSSAAPIIAARTPTQSEPVMLPITAAKNAPVRSWPSMAMFTTPTRSLMMPPMPPRIIGRASTRVLPSKNPTGTSAPAASQPSNETIATRPKEIVSHFGTRFLAMPNQSDSAAIRTISAEVA